jgi:cilia- and flagella-associated protein 65
MSKYKKPVELSIPDSYELGFCTVNARSEHPFTIFNPNVKPLAYAFKFTEFAVTPSKGVLLPNSYANFKIEFAPTEASVTVGTVVLEVEGESQRVVKLSAVGKYPYVSSSLTEIDFGQVLVTKTVTRELVIKNNSEVPAEFHIESLGSDGEFDQ